jgi:hypothetical protein
MNFAPFTYFNKAQSNIVAVTYVGSTFSTVGLTTYTFNNVNLGSPGLCIITIGHEHSGTIGRTVSSVTLAGVTMSLGVQQVSTGAVQATGAAILYLRQSAPTASIVVNFSGSSNRCHISVYNILNNTSDSPFQTRSNTSNTGRGFTQSYSGLSVDSVCILHYTIGLDSVTGLSWSNADLAFNFAVAGTTRYSGATFLTTTSGDRTIAVTHSNSTQPLSLAGCVWV